METTVDHCSSKMLLKPKQFNNKKYFVAQFSVLVNSTLNVIDKSVASGINETNCNRFVYSSAHPYLTWHCKSKC